MNGTLNRITRMALSLLGGLCFAAASFSTIAAPPSQISVTVNPTTGYFESTARTIVPPTNATISPVKDVSATVVSRLPNGALAQPISNGIEITALKQQQLVKSNVVAKPSALRRAGASCFKGGKCNLAFMAGAIGLEYLFDGLDWLFDEGSQIPGRPVVQTPDNVGYGIFRLNSYPDAQYQCEPVITGMPTCEYATPSYGPIMWRYDPSHERWIGALTPNGYGVTYGRHGECPLGSDFTQYGCISGYTSSPVSDAEIDAAFANYQPDPSDWRVLIPGIDLGDPDIDVEITDAPRLATPPVTTTHYDANGVPVTVTETNTWYDFAPKNNPSKQPELEAQKTETKNEYDAGGNPKGGTATTVVIPPASNPQAPESPESPIDCDLMPTLCEWMLWTKEPPPEGDEPDFDDIRQVIDLRDYQESVVIGPSTLACPEPYQIEIGFIGRTVGVSYQPFCDLADYVRPLLLMLAYFFGAYLTIRSI